MENFSNIIEHNTSELKNGNMSAYLTVLEDSIYQYEKRYGLMQGSAYLRNYVRSCFRNDLAKKGGYDSFGRKQFKTYINVGSARLARDKNHRWFIESVSLCESKADTEPT